MSPAALSVCLAWSGPVTLPQKGQAGMRGQAVPPGPSRNGRPRLTLISNKHPNPIPSQPIHLLYNTLDNFQPITKD